MMTPPVKSPTTRRPLLVKESATADSTKNNRISGAKNASAMATPPSRGMTRSLTLRPPGLDTAPTRSARRLTRGVRIAPTVAATRNAATKLRMVWKALLPEFVAGIRSCVHEILFVSGRAFWPSPPLTLARSVFAPATQVLRCVLLDGVLHVR
jgi:hypothetical protein